ncbi:MAG TPA: flagellar hook-basal body complex protein FliE [Methylophaga aminisulfidivorans]|jgi:flagellar hook-basal body complex protein FliE|uniref:flagellar hook-basal body complex protein FliE n=1 Tax=Methylophaga TaxID=40222 RepID=UPI00175A115E|nr:MULTISPECIES: flagellar hook-basal body complex protein FliE [Methylophaga]HIC47391.1 flagellar hook-basal body complex protein FliE [Methylophaga sp.]HIM38697.1 flagellar hook-basal body complex protein FliE [Methylophaga aminisulfidivorans]
MIKAIDPNQLLTQMRALQAQASPATQPLSADNAESNGRVDFGNVMKQAIGEVNNLQKTSGDLKTSFELGDPNVNLADVMIASEKAGVAFEATLQVRNKLIEAYQEVMRMSI